MRHRALFARLGRLGVAVRAHRAGLLSAAGHGGQVRCLLLALVLILSLTGTRNAVVRSCAARQGCRWRRGTGTATMAQVSAAQREDMAAMTCAYEALQPPRQKACQIQSRVERRATAGAASSAAPAPRKSPTRGRRWAGLAGSAAAALVLAGLMWWLGGRGEQQQQQRSRRAA